MTRTVEDLEASLARAIAERDALAQKLSESESAYRVAARTAIENESERDALALRVATLEEALREVRDWLGPMVPDERIDHVLRAALSPPATTNRPAAPPPVETTPSPWLCRRCGKNAPRMVFTRQGVQVCEFCGRAPAPTTEDRHE